MTGITLFFIRLMANAPTSPPLSVPLIGVEHIRPSHHQPFSSSMLPMVDLMLSLEQQIMVLILSLLSERIC